MRLHSMFYFNEYNTNIMNGWKNTQLYIYFSINNKIYLVDDNIKHKAFSFTYVFLNGKLQK